MRLLTQWLASRPRTRPCTTVVLHATAGSSLSGALSALKARELSYHYLIEKDGTVTKCVPYQRVAFHAGDSVGPNGPGVNSYSVGISFVNLNDGNDPYTAKQWEAARNLVYDLKGVLPLEWVTSHARISPGRKTDPRGFNLPMFAREVQLAMF